jgi:GT2 family glycosyltransferase
MGKKFGFVVLNYANYEETIACVESILAISGSNYFIVVVDNASPNNSFEVLLDRYSGYDNMKVMPSGKNGGYSYGNNCGIKFLESINIRDVIIATSDTLVVSKDILQQLEQMDSDDLGVVGPKVTNLVNDDQNPMLSKVDIKYIVNIHFPSIASCLRGFIYKVTPMLKSSIIDQKDNFRKNLLSSNVYMVHGCFLYITSYYFKKCGYLDESLFMYGEEDLLAYNCSQNNLRIFYQPSIEVIHKDARSTPVGNSNSFTVMNSNKSMKYLKKKLSLSLLLSEAFRRWKFL